MQETKAIYETLEDNLAERRNPEEEYVDPRATAEARFSINRFERRRGMVVGGVLVRRRRVPTTGSVGGSFSSELKSTKEAAKSSSSASLEVVGRTGGTGTLGLLPYSSRREKAEGLVRTRLEGLSSESHTPSSLDLLLVGRTEEKVGGELRSKEGKEMGKSNLNDGLGGSSKSNTMGTCSKTLL